MSSSKYVWRVENSKGLGPYNGPLTNWNVSWKEHPFTRMLRHHGDGSGSHPSRWKDFGASMGTEYVFGFASKRAAREWFRGYFTVMKRNGYTLKRLKADEVVVGNSRRQLAFVPARSRGKQ